MATADTTSDDDSSIENNDYPFTAILSDDGREQIDMVLRHISMVDEFRLNITSSGWNITVVDRSDVWMADIHIPTALFEEYDCSEHMEVGIKQVGIDRTRFKDALEGGRTINYGFNPTGNAVMTVGETDIEPIDPDSIRMEPDVPDLDLPSTVVVEDIEEFDHFVNEVPSDHVEFSCSSEGLALHAEGDTDSASYLLSNGNGCEVQHSTSNGLESPDAERIQEFHTSERYNGMSDTDVSLFSQDYLEDTFTKLNVKHVRDVSYELEMGTEFPIKLHRRDGSDVEMTFMIAPRISSE